MVVDGVSLPVVDNQVAGDRVVGGLQPASVRASIGDDVGAVAVVAALDEARGVKPEVEGSLLVAPGDEDRAPGDPVHPVPAAVLLVVRLGRRFLHAELRYGLRQSSGSHCALGTRRRLTALE